MLSLATKRNEKEMDKYRENISIEMHSSKDKLAVMETHLNQMIDSLREHISTDVLIFSGGILSMDLFARVIQLAAQYEAERRYFQTLLLMLEEKEDELVQKGVK